MATTLDQHYLQPVLSQQQVEASSHQPYQAESQEPNTNLNGYTVPDMSPSTQTSAHSQTSNNPVEPNMAEDNAGEAAQNASPAKGGRGGRSKARGGRAPAKTKAKVAKVAKAAANAKQAGAGRGRRQKVYDFIKAQAAHERMTELKSHFTQLARAMKPALNELADRTLAKLKNDPNVHKEGDEADPEGVHEFLDERLDNTLEAADAELKMRVDTATKLHDLNTRLTREECTNKILEAECEMLDSLLAKTDRLEYLHDNNLPVDLPDVSYQYKDITQQQVDQQGPYVHHNEQGVPVPCSERVTTLSQIMNASYQFGDEHLGKRKADGEPEGQPSAKRLGLLGLDDDVPRRTSALMSAHDDVGERSATPGEEQLEPVRRSTKAARAKTGAAAKQTWTTTNGTVVEEKDEDLMDVEEVNGLPLPKGASLPDEYGVRIITKSRKVEYANNRIMAPVASPFEEWQIGYRDSSNNPLKGATKARRREYLGRPNSNAAFYDRRVANYNSVLQREEDYDQELVKKHNLHPTLGLFMPNSVNMREYPVEKDLQQYNPVVQVGPKGQIFHTSRSVPSHRLDLEADKLEQRLRLKASVSNFMAVEDIDEEEVAPPKEIQEQHRKAVLTARAIDPASLPDPQEMPPPSSEQEPKQDDEFDIEPSGELLRGIEELLHAAEHVTSEENASKMASNTTTHKSSRPYDAIRDVFTENAPAVAPAPAPMPAPAPTAEPPSGNTYNLSFLAEVAENPDKAERILQEEMRRAETQRAGLGLQELEREQISRAEAERGGAQRAEMERQELEIQIQRAEFERQEHHRREFERQEAQRAEYAPPGSHAPGPVEVSVMDPRLFPHEVPHGNMQMAAPEAPQSQYPEPPQPNPYHSYDAAAQWQEPPAHPAEPPRGHDFLRTALNPQTPPPSTYPPYPHPSDYQGHPTNPAPPPQVSQPQGSPFINAAPQRGSLPALRPVRTTFDDGTVAPEYQGSPAPPHRPSLVASNSGVYYGPPPHRPYHNGYIADDAQHMHLQQSQVGPHPPHQHLAPSPVPGQHPQPMHPMLAPGPAPYPQSPDSGYGYPPLAPAPGAVVYQPTGPYNPVAPHPMTPVPARGPPGSSTRPYRKLEPAPAQQANKPRAGAQRPELRTVQFDYREGIKDYTPIEAPPSQGPSTIRGWSHQNLKQQRRASKEAAAPPAPTNDEPS